jgi:hypothetical protein
LLDKLFARDGLTLTELEADLAMTRAGAAYQTHPSEAMVKASADMAYPVPDVVIDGEIVEVDVPRRGRRRWRIRRLTFGLRAAVAPAGRPPDGGAS